MEPAGIGAPTHKLPTRMRAARYNKRGDSSVLRVEDNVPVPKTKPHDVLVRVAASSINPIDYKLRKMWQPFMYPKGTGLDGSGVVVAANPRSRFKTGDEVYFYLPLLSKSGAAAEYAAVPEANCAHIPPELDIFDAASLPLCACTAWQALEKAMPLSGKKVLIHGGSGGVGTLAIQIAKSQGAFVVTTCSSASASLCRDLGAEACIDYRTQGFEVESRALVPDGYDVVVSMVKGWDYDKKNLQLVKKGGHFTYIFRLIIQPSEWLVALYAKILWMAGKLRSCTVLVARGRHDLGLEQVARLVQEGRLRPVVSRTYMLDDIIEAHNALEQGSGTRGKIIVKSVPSAAALRG